MDSNKKIHPVSNVVEYPDGSREYHIEIGETYFERCAREFTAALLTTGMDYKDSVLKGINTSIILQKKLEEIKAFPQP